MANGHGGKRSGSGRKPKSLHDKLLDGNKSKRRPVVVNLPESNGDSIPRKCPENLGEFAVIDLEMSIEGIYESTVKWLEGTKCLHLISPALITEYAIMKTRWFECEWMVAQDIAYNSREFIAPNPMMDMSLRYLKAVNEIWDRIWAIVAQNSAEYYGDDPNRDAMARLLNSKPK